MGILWERRAECNLVGWEAIACAKADDRAGCPPIRKQRSNSNHRMPPPPTPTVKVLTFMTMPVDLYTREPLLQVGGGACASMWLHAVYSAACMHCPCTKHQPNRSTNLNTITASSAAIHAGHQGGVLEQGRAGGHHSAHCRCVVVVCGSKRGLKAAAYMKQHQHQQQRHRSPKYQERLPPTAACSLHLNHVLRTLSPLIPSHPHLSLSFLPPPPSHSLSTTPPIKAPSAATPA